MNFFDMLTHLEEGAKTRRSTWASDEYIDIEKFTTERRESANLIDIFSDDWEVLQ